MLPDSLHERLEGLFLRMPAGPERDEAIAKLVAASPEHAGAITDTLREWIGEGAPLVIGGYKLLDEVGRGGFGKVYRAQKAEGVEQVVALKVLRSDASTGDARRRFDREFRVLADLQHDGIAKFVDAGVDDDGVQWLAMEFVDGSPLDVFCDENRVSIPDRIDLFVQLCNAIMYAHVRGVIHRDLKPSNVLVIERPEGRAVKVIDFGVAHIANPDSDSEPRVSTLETMAGVLLGTPAFMAPEQVEVDSSRTDQRVDVYALGVILYQLILSRLPIPDEHFPQGNVVAIARAIQESTPPRPSEALKSLGNQRDQAAKERAITTGAWLRLARNDLGTIIEKAVEKSPDRRYQTVEQLAADIQHYISNEPIDARRSSEIYRLRKFAQRHCLQLTAAAIVLATLIGGGVATYVQWQRAEKQASDNLDLAEANDKIAKERTALAVAEREAKDAAQSNAQKFQDKSVEFEAKVKEFDQLATVVRYDNAVLGANRLIQKGAWPDAASELEEWLVAADELLAMRPEIETTVTSLREVALPWDEERRASFEKNHQEAFAQWQLSGRVLRSLQYAQAIRAGERSLSTIPLSAEQRALDPASLNKLAWERVTTKLAERKVWGEEALGLAAAQLAVEKATDDQDRLTYLHTLAWSWLANGRDRDALAASDEARRLAPVGSYESYQTAVVEAIDEAAQRISQAEKLYPDRPIWEYAVEDQAVAFLHRTLVELLDKLDSMEKDHRVLIAKKLGWARRIVELTRAHPNAKVAWSAVRDGIRTSDKYAGCDIPLADEDIATRWLGLVPLGANPVTGLFEFYHLRSACDGDAEAAEGLEIPSLREDGSIDLGSVAGIVFVLLPGGRVTLGSQRDDVGGALYDPASRKLIEAVFTVELSPFLLARHELTQGQWGRLWSGSEQGRFPSSYAAGNNVGGTFMTMAHPVEMVDADTCTALLQGHGLILPTEAQWEYGCRAGSESPWIVPKEELVRYANVSDQTAKSAGASWDCESWTDGFIVHAPVGSFLPNHFGLYDVHGNVFEWCRDRYAACGAERPGDGLRITDSPKGVYRGGCFNELSVHSRSAHRLDLLTSMQFSHLGLRASRRIE